MYTIYLLYIYKWCLWVMEYVHNTYTVTTNSKSTLVPWYLWRQVAYFSEPPSRNISLFRRRMLNYKCIYKHILKLIVKCHFFQHVCGNSLHVSGISKGFLYILKKNLHVFYDFNINTWLLHIVLAFTCNCLFLVCTLYRWFLYCTYIYQRYSLMTYVLYTWSVWSTEAWKCSIMFL